MFGGEDENAVGFESDSGFITNGVKHNGVMPDGVETWYREVDGDFEADARIVCRAEEGGIPLASSCNLSAQTRVPPLPLL